MSTVIWGIVALLLIFFVGMFATRRTTGGSNVFEFGRLFGGSVYQTIFVIILLPFLLVGMAARNFWLWARAKPAPPPPPLPVEGDDPIWSRERNKKLARDAFLAIEKARSARNPELAGDVLEDLIFVDLQAESDGFIARHEINTRNNIDLEEIVIHKERVDDQEMSGGTHSINWYFDAELRGTMTNFVSRENDGALICGSQEPQTFAVNMEFARTPAPTCRWRVSYLRGVPRAENRIEKLRHLKRK
jgi:hypothetical protein